MCRLPGNVVSGRFCTTEVAGQATTEPSACPTVEDVSTASLARRLGRRIASIRAEVGITQEKLAWEAGLASKGYLSRIEAGERLPSLEVLAKIARRLDVEVRDLLIFPSQDAVSRAMEQIRKSGAKVAGRAQRHADPKVVSRRRNRS